MFLDGIREFTWLIVRKMSAKVYEICYETLRSTCSGFKKMSEGVLVNKAFFAIPRLNTQCDRV